MPPPPPEEEVGEVARPPPPLPAFTACAAREAVGDATFTGGPGPTLAPARGAAPAPLLLPPPPLWPSVEASRMSACDREQEGCGESA